MDVNKRDSVCQSNNSRTCPKCDNRRVLQVAADTLQVRICGGACEHHGLLEYDSAYRGNKPS